MTWALVSPLPPVAPTWKVLSTSGSTSLGGAVKVRGSLVGVPLQGPPGPQGVQGPMGPSGGAGIERIADGNVSGHRAVRATSAMGVAYADPSTPAHKDLVVGITTTAALSGDPLTVLASGALVEPSWAWTPNALIYAGANGTLTQVPPSSGWLRILGFATSATSMVVQLLPPIVLS